MYRLNIRMVHPLASQLYVAGRRERLRGNKKTLISGYKLDDALGIGYGIGLKGEFVIFIHLGRQALGRLAKGAWHLGVIAQTPQLLQGVAAPAFALPLPAIPGPDRPPRGPARTDPGFARLAGRLRLARVSEFSVYVHNRWAGGDDGTGLSPPAGWLYLPRDRRYSFVNSSLMAGTRAKPKTTAHSPALR